MTMTHNPENIAVIGASGAIGGAFAARLAAAHPAARLHAFSRTAPPPHRVDYGDEDSIAAAAAHAAAEAPLDLVIAAGGILHIGAGEGADGLMPEKSLGELSHEKFRRIFEVNTITPALIAKHFLPRLRDDRRAIFAAMSARVGSIADNQLGGWYAYRASKAALNMIIKTASIEIGRRNKNAIIVGLHPGTVDSGLSKPFHAHVPEGRLFTPDHAAGCLLEVLARLTPDDSGRCFAWDGKPVPF